MRFTKDVPVNFYANSGIKTIAFTLCYENLGKRMLCENRRWKSTGVRPEGAVLLLNFTVFETTITKLAVTHLTA